MQIDVVKFEKLEKSFKPLVLEAKGKLIKVAQNLSFPNIVTMLQEEHIEDVPASTRVYWHYGFSGGWVLHTRNVLKIAQHYYKAYCKYVEELPKITQSLDIDFDLKTLLKVALLHDAGKLNNYYVRNDWYWISRGNSYKTNPDVQYVQHARRSLLLCIKYKIELSEDEAAAIILHDGPGLEENRSSYSDVGLLTLLLYQADFMANKLEKLQFNKYIYSQIEYISENSPTTKNKIIKPEDQNIKDKDINDLVNDDFGLSSLDI